MSARPNRVDERPKNSFKDLAQRAISAVTLALVAIALTIAGSWPFAGLVAAGSIVLAWEWSSLTSEGRGRRALLVHCIAVVGACALVLLANDWLAVVALIAGAISAAILAPGKFGRYWSALGVLYLGTTAVLLVGLRNDATHGLLSIIFLFIVVWSADTAAYFAGRAVGGRKLAPAISPGKTWSGAIAGILIPAVLAYAYALSIGVHAPFILALVGAGLALASQLGDLAQSAIKRNFNVKDSGTILPGHGGLFDRVDGMIGAVLAAGILVICRAGTISPDALLFW